MASLPSNAQRWAGHALTGLAGLALLASAALKLTHNPGFLPQWERLGYPERALTPVGLAELVCAILLLVPRTTVLGAVLITGYLGGAIAAHVRLGEPFAVPLALALLAWGGVVLREGRVRDLLPLRKREAAA